LGSPFASKSAKHLTSQRRLGYCGEFSRLGGVLFHTWARRSEQHRLDPHRLLQKGTEEFGSSWRGRFERGCKSLMSWKFLSLMIGYSGREKVEVV